MKLKVFFDYIFSIVLYVDLVFGAGSSEIGAAEFNPDDIELFERVLEFLGVKE
ncbi:MAG: hypothetical protein U9O64_02350 [Campylobacterota bacterium]|nr:hypothetical protein [Campylobacterota bacterium]